MNERCCAAETCRFFLRMLFSRRRLPYIQSVHLVARHGGPQAPLRPQSTIPQSYPPSALRAYPICPVAPLSALCSSLSLTYATHICPVEDIAHDTRHGNRIHEGEIRRPRRPAEIPPPVLVECYEASVSLFIQRPVPRVGVRRRTGVLFERWVVAEGGVTARESGEGGLHRGRLWDSLRGALGA